jgi:hypothetical protein
MANAERFDASQPEGGTARNGESRSDTLAPYGYSAGNIREGRDPACSDLRCSDARHTVMDVVSVRENDHRSRRLGLGRAALSALAKT